MQVNMQGKCGEGIKRKRRQREGRI